MEGEREGGREGGREKGREKGREGGRRREGKEGRGRGEKMVEMML